MNLFELVPLGATADPQGDATRFLTLLHSPFTKPYPLPIDPEAIANKIGLSTVEYDLPSICLGYLHWDELGPYIVVNYNQPACRRRFVQAQELGRFVDIMQTGNREAHQSGSYRNDSYAVCFAHELLMPRRIIAQLSRDLPHLAHVFDVDYATMQNRLSKLT